MSHIFVITKTVYLSLIFFVVGEQWRLRCLMASLTCLVLLLCHFMTQSLFILSQCVAITLNGFKKHTNCMTPKQRWYVTLTFCVWMWMTCKNKTWTRLTSVINFGMRTKLTSVCLSTGGGGIFSFGSMASSF